MLTVYLLAAICAAVVTGHPDGAPLTACDTMTPMHSTYTPQPSASPFEVTVTPNAITVGQPVSVMLMAADSSPFQGFLLKAMAVGQTTGVAGEFTMTMLQAMPCKYLNCNNVTQSALTHIDATNKTMVMVDWTTDTPGSYNIYGSVVQTYPNFWVKFPSEVITVTV